jgi:phenylpropionate dioxygenase-like ring-hydroxylating dioxygenase large terminal subunit
MTKRKPAAALSPDRIRYLALDPAARSIVYRSDPHNKAKATRCLVMWRRNNRERNAAANVVAQAIRNNRLVRGRCAGCGTDKFVCAYHDDYAKPYKVKWNCRRCRHVYRLAVAKQVAISIGQARGDR